jgi:hypothetical protein
LALASDCEPAEPWVVDAVVPVIGLMVLMRCSAGTQ